MPLRGSRTVGPQSKLRTSRVSRTVSWVRTRPAPMLLTGAAMALFVVTFSLLAIHRHRRFGTWGFDLGIYDQAFWLMSRGESFITIRGMNLWGHHFNLIGLLFVPFYRLGAGARFLLVVQVLSLSVAAIPAYRLARKRFNSERAGLLFALMTLGYAPLQWLGWNNFHPEALAVAPLMFAWWYAEDRRWRAFTVSCFVALTTREEAALVVTLLAGRILLKELNNRRKNQATTRDILRPLTMLAAGIGWFIGCSSVIIPHFNNGGQAFYVKHFYGDWGASLPEVMTNVLKRPGVVLRTLTESSRQSFFGRLFLLLGGLSFLSPLSLLILSPSILSTGLAHQGFIRDIRFQYTVFMVPVLLMSSIEGASNLVRKFAKLRFPMFIYVAITMMFGLLTMSPSPLGQNAGVWDGIVEAPTLRIAIKMVPKDASVAADDWIVPHFAHRQHVYDFPNPIVPSYYGATSRDAIDPNSADWIITFHRLPGQTDNAKATKEGKIVTALAKRGAVKILLDKNNVIVAKRVRLITNEDVADLRVTYALKES